MLPHITYIDKIAQSDLFIVSDDLVVNKNSFEIRNKYWCRLSESPKYLNLPIKEKVPFKNLEIRDLNFPAKWRKTLRDNYLRYPFFAQGVLDETLPDCTSSSFYEYYVKHISAVLALFNISTPIARASIVDTKEKKQLRLNDIVHFYQGTEYLSGTSGKKYFESPTDYKLTFHNSKDEKFLYNESSQYLMFYDMIFTLGIDEVKKRLGYEN